MIYMNGLRIFAVSMRSAILSILFILSRTEYSTDVLENGDSEVAEEAVHLGTVGDHHQATPCRARQDDVVGQLAGAALRPRKPCQDRRLDPPAICQHVRQSVEVAERAARCGRWLRWIRGYSSRR